MKDEPHDKGQGNVDFDITVNGVQEVWSHKVMTYQQAVELAFPNGQHGGNVRYNVSWTKPDGSEGSLRPASGPIEVVEGMILDVRNTDKS